MFVFFLLTKQKQVTLNSIGTISYQNFQSTKIFPEILTVTTYNISHRIFYIHLYSFICIFLHSPTKYFHLWYLSISNNWTLSHLRVYIYFLSCPSDINSTLFIFTKYVVSKVPKIWSFRWIFHEISPHLIRCTIFYMYIFPQPDIS